MHQLPLWSGMLGIGLLYWFIFIIACRMNSRKIAAFSGLMTLGFLLGALLTS